MKYINNFKAIVDFKEMVFILTYQVMWILGVGKTLVGYKRGRPLPVLLRMGRPPSSASQKQTSTSTWNPTSYT